MDFEWQNRTLHYGYRKRAHSYWPDTILAATDLPSRGELALLEPHRADLPPELFTRAFRFHEVATPQARRETIPVGATLGRPLWSPVLIDPRRSLLKHGRGQASPLRPLACRSRAGPRGRPFWLAFASSHQRRSALRSSSHWPPGVLGEVPQRPSHPYCRFFQAGSMTPSSISELPVSRSVSRTSWVLSPSSSMALRHFARNRVSEGSGS